MRSRVAFAGRICFGIALVVSVGVTEGERREVGVRYVDCKKFMLGLPSFF